MSESQRRAEDTYTSIEDELAAIHKEILYMALLLGTWRAQRHDADLRSIAASANVVALAARDIEKMAAEQAERP
jgi:hypothetical protein